MLLTNLKLKYGEYPKATIYSPGHYGDGSPAVDIVDAEGLVAHASICMPSGPPAPGCIWVKDYSENEGMAQSLIDAGLIKATGRSSVSGFVAVAEYEMVGALAEEVVK